ncbi:UNKNOWN [Stylonychia lemnae]|uniref:Uncharacterized protein n=1 Tax=Stylonychia lemnae TaxID=5949 RepID=A0A077ZXX1_STYLE|nr:UNKNOWN [Stylonychia lemnae]|eukprot:CDW74442.1 UNKNOWN [Stylonychia lemnae]
MSLQALVQPSIDSIQTDNTQSQTHSQHNQSINVQDQSNVSYNPYQNNFEDHDKMRDSILTNNNKQNVGGEIGGVDIQKKMQKRRKLRKKTRNGPRNDSQNKNPLLSVDYAIKHDSSNDKLNISVDSKMKKNLIPFKIYMGEINQYQDIQKVQKGSTQVNLSNRFSRSKLPPLQDHKKRNRSPLSIINTVIPMEKSVIIQTKPKSTKGKGNLNRSLDAVEPEPEDLNTTSNLINSSNQDHLNSHSFLYPENYKSLSTIQIQQPVSLGQAKRLNHEKDYQLQQVHNRIRVLQMEEERTLKKIDETRKKAKFWLDIQKKAHISHITNSMIKNQSKSEIQSLIMERKESVKRIDPQEQINKMVLKKQEQVKAIRDQSKQFSKEIEQQAAMEIYQNMKRSRKIRHEVEQAQVFVDKAKRDKINNALNKKEQEFRNERKEIKQKEKALKKLSMLEGILLNKLQETSKFQRETIEELSQSKYLNISSQHISLKQTSRASQLNYKRNNNTFNNVSQDNIAVGSKELRTRRNSLERYKSLETENTNTNESMEGQSELNDVKVKQNI